jgi:cytosine/adenosine deaminase-related metal-dependent hydrolase
VTTVVNIESFPWLLDEFQAPPLRIIWCLELLDTGRTDETEQIFAEVERAVDEHPQLLQDYGFSPHAPYSTSAGMYALAAKAAEARGVLLTTHLAESEEEDDMIRRGTGHMYDYFHRAGRDMADCKRVGPVQLLHELHALGPHCLAAHVNCVTPLDIQLLQKTGTHVVHCPKTHRYFGRGMPMLKSFWAAGVNVCLGTDSLASNNRLNMFEEMRTLAHVCPEVECQQLVAMATTHAARALGREGKLGVLAAGAAADIIAVRPVEAVVDPHETVVFNEEPLSFLMVNGRESNP